MPLHIGVDAWNLTGDRRGVGRYVREIVQRWATWQADLRISLLVPERPPWFARKRYLKELSYVELPVLHRSAASKFDAVWYPWNGMSWEAKTIGVASLHDASLFSLPSADEEIRLREQRPFRLAATKAARIITDSQFSKEELVRHLQLDPARVDVVHLGVKQVFAAAGQERASLRAGLAVRPRYLLFVGEPEERKGLDTLLQAMALLPSQLRDETELIIAGASGQYPLPATPRSVRVRNVGWVDDRALVALYSDAAALVYPSRYEGFGLPIIEAMAVGTPVIASDVPGLREAGAAAAIYVPPKDASALAGAIASVLSEPEIAGRLSRLGLARARELSWDETARRTLAILERAIKESKAR